MQHSGRGNWRENALGCQGLVQFFQQLWQLIAKELMGFPEAALLEEGRVVEVVQFDAEAVAMGSRMGNGSLMRSMPRGGFDQ